MKFDQWVRGLLWGFGIVAFLGFLFIVLSSRARIETGGVIVGGSEGTSVQGMVSDGITNTAKPIPIAGVDSSNRVQVLTTTNNGVLVITGSTSPAAATTTTITGNVSQSPGNTYVVSGNISSAPGSTIVISGNTSQSPGNKATVVGSIAGGSPATDNPVLIAGMSIANVRTMSTTENGEVNITGNISTAPGSTLVMTGNVSPAPGTTTNITGNISLAPGSTITGSTSPSPGGVYPITYNGVDLLSGVTAGSGGAPQQVSRMYAWDINNSEWRPVRGMDSQTSAGSIAWNSMAQIVQSQNWLYNPVGGEWVGQRAVTTYPTAVTSAMSDTLELVVWTPAAGKKFRVKGLNITGDFVAGDLITVKDGAAGTVIINWYIPAGGLTTPLVIDYGSNGKLSATANNKLVVSHDNTGAQRKVAVNAWGNEE